MRFSLRDKARPQTMKWHLQDDRLRFGAIFEPLPWLILSMIGGIVFAIVTATPD